MHILIMSLIAEEFPPLGPLDFSYSASKDESILMVDGT